MIKKIIEHIEYRKKVKFLKRIAVNQLANFAVNKADYITGFEKLLLAISESDNTAETQKILADFMDLARKTKIANDVVNKNKAE